MQKNALSKKRLKNHFAYSWWKYLLALAVCAMGINLVFAMTEYRPPAEKKIELYALCGLLDQVEMEEDFWPALHEKHPEQELFTAVSVNMLGNDPYAAMQLMTYTAAQQGDIFLIPEVELDRFIASGADEAFVELTPYVESGVIDTGDMDLSKGMLPDSTGGKGLYAIPAGDLYGFLRFRCNPENCFLCIMAYSGNQDVAASAIDLMIERYRVEKPEGWGEETPAPAAPIY